MCENLKKLPPKGILKQSSSFDNYTASTTPRCSISGGSGGGGVVEEEEGVGGGGEERKSTKFDEMNILQTLHPPDKDYGFMKIQEPKTPFNYYDDGEDSESKPHPGEILLDPEELVRKIKEKGGEVPSCLQEQEEEEEEGEKAPTSVKFESKRKAHYNEYFAVKLARQLMEKEEEDSDSDSSSGAKKFIPEEETGE